MARPKKTPDTAAMLEVSRLYYEKELTKQTIAQQRRTDVREVTWLLSQARQHRLVRIEIVAPFADSLENQIRERFPHVEKVMVAGAGTAVTTTKAYAALVRQWAVVAADYFNHLAVHATPKNPIHVGVTGGSTIFEFASAVPQRERNVHVHTTALIGRGRMHKSAAHIDPIVNASILWSHCGGVGLCDFATVPPYHGTKPGPEARTMVEPQLEKLAEIEPIREVIKAMDSIDVVFAGIGMVNPPGATLDLRNRISAAALLRPIVTPQQLADEGAVADFSYNIIDAQGRSKENWRFFLSAGHYSDHSGIAFFQHMVETGKKVVAIAGVPKLPAIKAALAARVFNVLITDEATGRQLAEGD